MNKQLKRFWVSLHWETEIESESEEDAYTDALLGNTIGEEASIAVVELSSQLNTKEEIERIRQKTLRDAMISVVLRQMFYKTHDSVFHHTNYRKATSKFQEQFDRLSLKQLQDLSIAVLDFKTSDDFNAYLPKMMK